MTEWIHAYDAGCAVCADVSDRVRKAAGARLALAGLAEPRIRELRRQALGDAAVWAPTLLAVDRDGVRAWTGRALALRLAWRLGPIRSTRVVGGVAGSAAVRVPGRRRFLRVAPLAALGAFALSGGIVTPAAAAQRSARTKADAWAAANRATLPTGYDQVTSYPMVQRTAIFRALPPAARRNLWTEHFARYSATHPDLNPRQRAVLTEAAQALDIACEDQLSQRNHATLARLRTHAVAAFGEDGALALVATLGPAEPQSSEPAAVPNDCDCAVASNWCDDYLYCDRSCPAGGIGCGTLLSYPCDGKCTRF
jgi:hypothetical protein